MKGYRFGGKNDQFVLGSGGMLHTFTTNTSLIENQETRIHIWSSDTGGLLRTVTLRSSEITKTPVVVQWNPMATSTAIFITGEGKEIRVWRFQSSTDEDIEKILLVPEKTETDVSISL